jgi:hypothetical protein
MLEFNIAYITKFLPVMSKNLFLGVSRVIECVGKSATDRLRYLFVQVPLRLRLEIRKAGQAACRHPAA